MAGELDAHAFYIETQQAQPHVTQPHSHGQIHDLDLRKRESLCIGNYGGDYGDYYGTTAASTASFRRQIFKSGIRRWLLDVLLLIHSRKPARHLKTGPRSQKVGLVSITKVFFGGFYVLK